MKHFGLFIVAVSGLVLMSCRKFDCICQTEHYDSAGNYVNTTAEKHTVKAFTTLKATAECNSKESSTGTKYTYCSLD